MSTTARIAGEAAATAPFGATVLAIGDETLAAGITRARPDLTVHAVPGTADLSALPHDDQSVDLIVSTVPLHGRPDAAAIMAELAGVLRPGGRIALYDPRPAAAPDLPPARPPLCPIRLFRQVREAVG